jgi:hypothetical protein
MDLAQVIEGGAGEPALAFSIDGGGGAGPILARPGFDFDEGEAIVVAHDEIDFAVWGAEIGGEEFESGLFQKSAGGLFAEFAAAEMFRGWGPVKEARSLDQSGMGEQLGLRGFERGKAASVDGAGTEALEGLEMFRGAIALVRGETVGRIEFVELEHQTVAGDFGDDACGGDRVTEGVALDHCCLGAVEPRRAGRPSRRMCCGGGIQGVEARRMASWVARRMLMASMVGRRGCDLPGSSGFAVKAAKKHSRVRRG